MFHWEKRKIYNIDTSLMLLNTRICSSNKTNTPIPKFSLRVRIMMHRIKRKRKVNKFSAHFISFSLNLVFLEKKINTYNQHVIWLHYIMTSRFQKNINNTLLLTVYLCGKWFVCANIIYEFKLINFPQIESKPTFFHHSIDSKQFHTYIIYTVVLTLDLILFSFNHLVRGQRFILINQHFQLSLI